MYNCFYIVLTSTMGGLFFGEFKGLSVVSLILFPLGVAVTLTGIYGMTLGGADAKVLGDSEKLSSATPAPDPAPPV